jgi:two-component system response regulator YesN
MSYKVFFVEDEIVTREGIRDNVDWQADGFELCGEAPDGEMALPLLQATKPDVLITDIKMPFMDGLQLSKIVRERMPHTKIVILSGHDEFEYAQQAIQLGVTEYLLKPVTVQDLHAVLQRVARKIMQEEAEQAKLAQLRKQVQENRAALIERLLLKLLVGAISSVEAIEQSEWLGLDLIARFYLVAVVRIGSCESVEPFDYALAHRVQDILASSVAQNPDVFLLRKDVEEFVLILKGSTQTCLEEDKDFLLDQITRRAQEYHCTLRAGIGAPRSRITDIGQSFLEALAQVQRAPNEQGEANAGVDTSELLKVDKSAVQDYLKCGIQEEFPDFFDAFLFPLGAQAFQSTIVKNYVLLDLVFTAAHFVQELGGDAAVVLPELEQIETILNNLQTIEQFKEQTQQILGRALAFRDDQAGALHAGVIQQAKEYIDRHYMDPDISLHAVARRVGHSPCHFSTVFGAETGRTFKEYLTDIRIKRAKELLRTTTLRSIEIAEQVGYSDPHYFSAVFRKSTGLSPKEFRLQGQGKTHL